MQKQYAFNIKIKQENTNYLMKCFQSRYDNIVKFCYLLSNHMNNHDKVSRTIFLNTLQWLLAVINRYSDQFNFALVKIAYGNKNELGDAYGAPEALKHLSTLTKKLQDTFRKADLVTRNGTDFWIIFPYTPFSENIYEKIRGVIDNSPEELSIVDREITIFTSPFTAKDEKNDIESSIDMLDFLKDNQAQYAKHTFHISAEEIT